MIRFTRAQTVLATGCLVGILVFLGIWSYRSPHFPNSTLLGKTLPDIPLPYLQNSEGLFAPNSKLGQVWMLNVWATWCAGCRAEHQTLLSLANQSQIDIVGLNYKDAKADSTQWLQKLGNPYSDSLIDLMGTSEDPWKINALPITYIIDQSGTVRYSHVGPIDTHFATRDLVPLLDRLQATPSTNSDN